MTTESASTTPGQLEYHQVPFKKGLKRRHTIMALSMLPIALGITLIAQMAVILAYLPFIINDLRDTLTTYDLSSEAAFSEASYELLSLILSAPEFLTVSAIAQFISFVLAAFFAKFFVSGRNIKYIFSPRTYQGFLNKFGLPTKFDKTFRKHVLIGLALGAGMYLALQLASFGLVYFNGSEALESSETSQMVLGYGSWVLMLIVVPIIAPIVEELLFRGGILGFLSYPDVKNSSSRVSALIVSALLFSIMHLQGFATMMDFFVLAWTFTLGLALGISYIKTGKITSAIVAHAVYNGIQAVLFLIV